MNRYNLSRRTALKTGIAAIAAAPSLTPSAFAQVSAKAPGETKIVAVMGDYWHPSVSQETHIRQILGQIKGSKIYFVLASRYLTPELLADADLFISARYAGNDDPAWVSDPVVTSRPRGDTIWTDTQVSAVFENVEKRGMGWLACHCTIFSGRPDI